MMGSDASSEADEDEEDEDSSDDEAAAIEKALVQGKNVGKKGVPTSLNLSFFSSFGKAGGEGSRGVAERKRAKKGKGREALSDSEDSEDSDDEDAGMFRGEGTWADDDEGFIRGIQVSSFGSARFWSRR